MQNKLRRAMKPGTCAERPFRLRMVACLCLALGWGSGFAGDAPQVPLVPFQGRIHMSDQRGGQWFASHDMSVHFGIAGNMNGSMQMLYGGGQVNWTSRMQTADGTQMQFSGQTGGLTILRTLTFLSAEGAVRMVDVYTNATSQDAACAPALILNTGGGNSQVRSDLGRNVAGALERKESGVVVSGDPNMGQTDLMLALGAPGNRVKPTVAIPGNGTLSVQWNLTVKPSSSLALMTVLALRPGMSSLAPKELANAFKPFFSRQVLAALPGDLRKQLVNIGASSSGGGGMQSILNIEALGITRGDTDQVAFGESTILKGTASCTGFAVATDFGSATLSVEQVAAVAGPGFTKGAAHLYLRDGQILSGTVGAEGLSFISRTGLSLPLTMETLDRLILREDTGDGTPLPETRFFLTMFDGSRLSLSNAPETPLSILSTWGPRTIPFGEIERLEALDDGMTGYRIATRDGSQYFCYLLPEELDLTTLLFGSRRIHPARIRTLVAVADVRKEADDAESKPETPFVRTVGDSIVCGTIELDAVRLRSGAEVISIPPAQIRTLVNEDADYDTSELAAPIFVGELWGSGTIAGEVIDFVLPVRTAHGLVQIPVRDIVEIAVPTPAVPDGVRQRIAELIRDLGNDNWTRRDRASAELAELGIMARQQLTDQVMQTADEEVRWRIQKLLDAMGN